MADKFRNLARVPEETQRAIGAILIGAGKITAADAVRAQRLQEAEGLRFGEACVKLGLVTPADVERVLSEQFGYPCLLSGENDLGNELVAAYKPFDPEVEAMRALRTELLLRWISPERRMLAICSPARGDGRSYLAANLAVAFAQLGKGTLLVDADMRRPRQHEIFHLSNRTGLSDTLAGRGGAECVRPVAHFSRLWVLAAGPMPPNPLELLSGSEFANLIDQLKQRFEVVLIDTPAASAGADAQMIAVRAGAALVLAREGQTRFRELQNLAASVASSHAVVVGSVSIRM
jgi:chain length determinant protein tyrosine kinase EpsG